MLAFYPYRLAIASMGQRMGGDGVGDGHTEIADGCAERRDHGRVAGPGCSLGDAEGSENGLLIASTGRPRQPPARLQHAIAPAPDLDRKSTRLNSSH